MTTCMESYACICRNLEWNPSPEAKEALEVIREFRHVFETADAAIENPVLQEICRNISRIHFGCAMPLETMPVDTIKKEFKKRTGKDISSYFCTIAYHNTIKADREKTHGTEREKNRGSDTDKTHSTDREKTRGADTDKARRGEKSGILDADTEQQKSLIRRLIEMAEEKAERCAEEKEEENREDKTKSCSGKDNSGNCLGNCSEDSSDNCPNCTCSGGN